jgi:lysozyme
MNERLKTNSHGLRLIRQFEGPPRTAARLCEGGRWELGAGITFDLDGQPFQQGDTCTEQEAEVLFANALRRFELAVVAHVDIELNENQFSALVALAYNIGEANFAGSTVLREVNARRFDDAAAAFGRWLFATQAGHKQALRGLLRRRYAEACLFLSYDWIEATEDDFISLKRERPASLPGTDRVIYKTPWSEVLRVAQTHPLPADKTLFEQPALSPEAADSKGVEVVPVSPGSASIPTPSAPSVESSRVPGAEEGASPSTASPVVAPAKPPPPIQEKPTMPAVPPAKVPQTVDVTKFNINNIKVENGAKPLEGSDRAVAFAIKFMGVTLKRGAAFGFVPVAASDFYFDFFGDPFITAAVIAGSVWAIGELVEWIGHKKREKHNKTASTLLY